MSWQRDERASEDVKKISQINSQLDEHKTQTLLNENFMCFSLRGEFVFMCSERGWQKFKCKFSRGERACYLSHKIEEEFKFQFMKVFQLLRLEIFPKKKEIFSARFMQI